MNKGLHFRILGWITGILLILNFPLFCQSPPDSILVDWSTAGLSLDIISPDTSISIIDFGGIPDGSTSNQTSFVAAQQALGGSPGIIYFPAGEYYFSQPIFLEDGIILKGAGADSTKLVFDLGGDNSCVNIVGSRSNTPTKVSSDACKGQFFLPLEDTSGILAGDYFILLFDDSQLVNDLWAENSVGQINRIVEVKSDRIVIEHALRQNYMHTDSPYVEIIFPKKQVGIECLNISRLDNTATNRGNISFNIAAECWVSAVESEMCSFAHVILERSTKCSISGSYFHHAHAYGSGGNAYGVNLQFTSGDNKIENCIFEHLRHSMILQAGVNGNVFSYNYSTDPYKTVFGFPTNNTADMVCHGNYVYANLFEGNIASFGIVDASHGSNGPNNTFFRNRMSLYGMQISNSTPDNDMQTIIGNEVSDYIINENGHYEYGNNLSGTIIPAGTDSLYINSYYSSAAPEYFDTLSWPSVGFPHLYGSGTSPAEQRYLNGSMKTSNCPIHETCPDSVTVSSVGYISPDYRAGGHVISSAKIYPFQSVKFTSIEGALLNPGFVVKKGGEFLIINDNCNQ